MKYGDLTLSQMEALANKIGGMESVRRLLADEPAISEPTRVWETWRSIKLGTDLKNDNGAEEIGQYFLCGQGHRQSGKSQAREHSSNSDPTVVRCHEDRNRNDKDSRVGNPPTPASHAVAADAVRPAR